MHDVLSWFLQTPKFLGIVISKYLVHRTNNDIFVQGLATDMPAKAFFRIMTEQVNESVAAMERLREHQLGKHPLILIHSSPSYLVLLLGWLYGK